MSAGRGFPKAPPLDGEGLGRGELPRLARMEMFTPTLPSPIKGEEK